MYEISRSIQISDLQIKLQKLKRDKEILLKHINENEVMTNDLIMHIQSICLHKNKKTVSETSYDSYEIYCTDCDAAIKG